MAVNVRRARQVASEIEADIERGGWQVGTILGSEPELCERYRVSRAVLREAVRLLESKKVARMKAGRGGGLLICEPDADLVITSAALLLGRMNVELKDLLEAHRALAVTNARHAAERAEEPDIDRLRLFLDAFDGADQLEPAEIRAIAMQFHLEIAMTSQNPVLAVFTEVLATLINQRVRLPPAQTWPAVHHAHTRIIEAVIAQDAPLAQHRMGRHFAGIADSWFAADQIEIA